MQEGNVNSFGAAPWPHSSYFDLQYHILSHTSNMSRLEAAPRILLQSTTKVLPRPRTQRVSSFSSSSTASSGMEASHITINGQVFSRHECEIACAIKLYVKNASNQTPSDETMGYVLRCMRGEVNGIPLQCHQMVHAIEHYNTEAVRSIYLSVCSSINIFFETSAEP